MFDAPPNAEFIDSQPGCRPTDLWIAFAPKRVLADVSHSDMVARQLARRGVVEMDSCKVAGYDDLVLSSTSIDMRCVPGGACYGSIAPVYSVCSSSKSPEMETVMIAPGGIGVGRVQVVHGWRRCRRPSRYGCSCPWHKSTKGWPRSAPSGSARSSRCGSYERAEPVPVGGYVPGQRVRVTFL